MTLVERLRDPDARQMYQLELGKLLFEAAAEIESLQRECGLLRDAVGYCDRGHRAQMEMMLAQADSVRDQREGKRE